MESNRKAEILFADGFSCSQSVLTARAEQFGLLPETALRLSAAFGAGMGRQGEVCGAATGALMVIGLAAGHTSAADKDAKERTYLLAHRFLDEFARRNGSMYCRELLGGRLDDPESFERARQQGLFSTICPRLVADASRLLDEMLNEEIP